MTIAIVAGLIVMCVILLKRAQETRSENVVLKGQVASLKRQLARLRA
jgi:hypothetical protein